MSDRHYNNETRTDMLVQVIERDGPYCMGKGCFVHLSLLKPIDVHLHHIKPINQGGCDHIENLVALCRTCHSKERNNTLEIRSNITRLGLCVCEQVQVKDGVRLFQGSLADAAKIAGKGGRVERNRDADSDDWWIIQTALEVEQERAKEKKEADALQAAKEDAALTPVMRVNKRCEKPFNEWINRMIQTGWKHDYETWANAGAQEFRCSPETIKKYLNKRCNPINGDLFTRIEDDGSGNKESYLAFRKLTE